VKTRLQGKAPARRAPGKGRETGDKGRAPGRAQLAEQAFVLVKVKSGSSEAVEDALSDMPGVKLAHSVMGPYDVVVFVEGPNIDGLREMIMRKFQTIPGVRHTTTLLVV
jgi:DNA-binding Lrp family transcriptional regulator